MNYSIGSRETLAIGAGLGAALVDASQAGANPGEPEEALAAVGAQAPHEWLQIGTSRLAVTRRGKGRPVLCLHAIAHGARDFEALATRAGDQCEIIAIDFPGHGRSPTDGAPVRVAHYADITLEVISRLGLVKPILLGNSIGGGAAILAASRDPHKIGGLILCDPSGLSPPSPLAETTIKRMIGLFQAGIAKSPAFPPAFAKYYEDVVLPAAPAKAQRDRIIASGFQVAPLLADAWTGFLEPASYLGNLAPNVSMPVWFAWARNDKLVAWDYSRAAAETFPSYRLDFFEGGHSPFLEAPDSFAVGLQRFVGGLT